MIDSSPEYGVFRVTWPL